MTLKVLINIAYIWILSLFCFLYLFTATVTFPSSTHDKVYNDSMIKCSINNDIIINLNEKIKNSMKQKYHRQLPHHHQQKHQEKHQVWLPVKRQSTEWCAQNNLFKIEIDLQMKNKTYHDLIQHKNNKSYRKRYHRYLHYLKYGWYEGYSEGFPGSEMNRYTTYNNITSIPYGCWFDIIHDIPKIDHHPLKHNSSNSSRSGGGLEYQDKANKNLIWINIGKKRSIIIILTNITNQSHHNLSYHPHPPPPDHHHHQYQYHYLLE